jgi:cytochrome c oxidase cbb3-type subunit 3
MPNTGHVFALLAGAVLAASGCKGAPETKGQGTETAMKMEDRIIAGGVAPAANALSAPRPASATADAGGNLFATMNCDGCHGGGAIGWVGPSLVDGRWRYGGTDDEIFTSIYYGRPKGMPAYGGVLGAPGVWAIVAYIKAQAVPPVVPTTSWMPGGNATNAPAGGVKEGDEPKHDTAAASPQ